MFPTQSGCMGRDLGPLSPPAITQSIGCNPLLRNQVLRSSEPSKGSHERNRTTEPFFSKNGRRFSAYSWVSTVVPSHTFAGQVRAHGTMLAIFCGRLVKSNQSSHGVASISFQRRCL